MADFPPEIIERLSSLEADPAIRDDRLAFDLLAGFSPIGAGGSCERLLAAARSAFIAGYPRSALAAVREASRRVGTRPEPALLLCSFLLRMGDPEAQPLLERCLADFPQRSSGWVEIGEAFLHRNQRAAALIGLARGLPDSQLSIRCGLLARDLGQRDRALALFKDAVSLDPRSTRAWFLLGTCAEDVRDFAAAAAAYRKVLQLDPDRAEAAVNLGIVLQGAGDLEGAKQAFARAVRTNPATFGRIAQALPGSPKGELWLDLAALRRSLAG